MMLFVKLLGAMEYAERDIESYSIHWVTILV